MLVPVQCPNTHVIVATYNAMILILGSCVTSDIEKSRENEIKEKIKSGRASIVASTNTFTHIISVHLHDDIVDHFWDGRDDHRAWVVVVHHTIFAIV